MTHKPISFYNRYTQKNEEESIYGESWLRWAYETRLGNIFTRLIASQPFFSKWYGWRMDKSKSAKKVRPFIQKYNIPMQDFSKKADEFTSFNDFFYRTLSPNARPIDSQTNSITFPADGRHLTFCDITKTQQFYVKGQKMNLELLLGDRELAKQYEGGSLIFSRLCPVDYHRFHFPVSGIAEETKEIKGSLFSVNPIALKKKLSIFWQNNRTVTKIKTQTCDTVLMLEIGATCVGSIKQTYQAKQPIQKGDEKGYFRFGGSSTILLFKKGTLQIENDLLEKSAQAIETYARMGDSLGYVIGNQ